MQACPYDAIYLNEDTGSAEKCHFCAHRVEKQLEPACVVVCPERAIVAGDMDDPNSEIRNLVASHPVSVRKPEQGTGPNLFYIDADSSVLTPTEPRHEESYLWSERATPAPEGANFDEDTNVRVAYDVSHPAPWGWKVGTYLWTKAIAAGAAVVAPFAKDVGLGGNMEKYGPEITVLLFLGITTFLLIEDLARPSKFYTILTRPNWKSWLVRGTVILAAFGTVTPAIIALQFLGAEQIVTILRWINVGLALAAAAYSGFLFAQAEGRDFWQSPLRAPHLAVEAVVAGAAIAVLAGADAGRILLFSLAAHLLFVMADVFTNHGGKDAERAKHLLTHGVFAQKFWLAMIGGAAVPIVLLLIPSIPLLYPIAALASLAGLLGFGLLWVKAGQAVPLS